MNRGGWYLHGGKFVLYRLLPDKVRRKIQKGDRAFDSGYGEGFDKALPPDSSSAKWIEEKIEDPEMRTRWVEGVESGFDDYINKRK